MALLARNMSVIMIELLGEGAEGYTRGGCAPSCNPANPVENLYSVNSCVLKS